jgi:uncharacterized OB-fold protein
MTVDAPAPHVPATSFIKFGRDGAPFIEGQRCKACGAPFLEARPACARCGSRDGFTAFEASNKGTLYTYSIVQRSFPGVPTPFISAIVDLEDGLVLKGILQDVAADPAKIAFGMPVRVVFEEAPGQQSADGRPFVAYYFKPAAA